MRKEYESPDVSVQLIECGDIMRDSDTIVLPIVPLEDDYEEE